MGASLDVNVLRESISKVTKILSGRGITVTQRGSSAYVESNKKGEPVRVNLPYIPDSATQGLIDAINGFLDHEVGHLMFSDFKTLAKSARMGEEIQQMTNIIEDPFVERQMAKRFRGSATNLDNVGKFFLEKYTTPTVEGAIVAGDSNKILSALMVPAIRAWSGQKLFQDYMADKWPLIEEFVGRIPPECIERLAKVNSTDDSLEIAVAINKALTEDKPKGGKSGKSDSKPKKKSTKSGGGKGESDKEKGEKGEDDEGSVSTKSADDDENEGGKGKSSKGKSKDDTEEEKDDSSGGGGEKGDEESPGDDGDSGGGDSDDEGDEDEGDDEKPEDDDEDEGGDSDDEGDEEEEADDDGEDDAESEDDSDEEEDEGETEEPDEDDDEEEESDEGDDEDEKAFMTPEEFKGILGKDFDDIASELITDDATKEAKVSEYIVYTRDYDRIEAPKEVKHFQDRYLEELEESVRHIVGPLQKNLERLILANERSRWQPGLRRGKVNAASLFKLKTGDDRVFRKRETIGKTKNVAVSLVIDLSGSMGGSKMRAATQATYALAQTLDRLGITYEVIGFTTKSAPYTSEDRKRMESEQAKMGRRYSRSEAIYMPVFKSFAEPFRSEQKKRIAIADKFISLANNVDGESIEYAAERLLKQQAERHIMFVMSDGEPLAAGNTREQAYHLRNVVQKFSKVGVDMFGIGIQTSAVKRFYPDYVVLENVSELPSTIMGQLKRVLLN